MQQAHQNLAAPAEVKKAFGAKIKKGIFRHVGRSLPEAVREDRWQEAVSLVFEIFIRYAREGRQVDDALLVHAANCRVVDPARQLCRADGTMRRRDVYDPRAFFAGEVRVLRLAGILEEDQREEDGSLGLALLGAADPTDRLASAVDLQDWLAELSAADREILELRGAGDTLNEVGKKVGMTIEGVYRKCRCLGQELATRAAIEVEPRRRTRRNGPAAPSAGPTKCAKSDKTASEVAM